MKHKKILAILAVTLSFSMGLTACSFGGKKDEDVVVEQPEAEQDVEVGPTEAPAAPDIQTATYTSADGKIAIKLPDATWSVKADQDGLYSFGSPEQGSVMIEHGVGGEALSTQIIPKSQDTAATLEVGTAGTDYEIRNYLAAEEGGNGIYSYAVKMLKDDSDYAYKLYKVFANDNEFFIITGTVVSGDAASVAEIQNSMDSLQILDKHSSLQALAAPTVQEEAAPEETKKKKKKKQQAAEETQEEASAPVEAAAGGIAPSSDNPDNGDNTKTRTIYTNDGTGRAIVVTLNAEGTWVDVDGNQYRFQGESDCYDQNDVDYYYHGEAADVYFLPVE